MSAASPRQADRQRGVGRQGLGAGRRLPVHALLRADGRCRLARILGVLSRASSTIAEGEVLQLVSQRDTSTPEATYLEVIKAKTAKLFAAAAEVGAMVAGRDGAGAGGARKLRHESRHRLPAGRRCARLCRPRGRARQDGRRRLPRGQDHPAGDPGLPARRHRRARVLEAHHREARPARGRPRAGQGAARSLRGLADTLERARHYGAMARDALGLFPDKPLKAALLEAVDFAIARAH